MQRGKEVGSQAHWARKLDKLEEDLSFLFPDWQQEEVEQAFFYPGNCPPLTHLPPK